MNTLYMAWQDRHKRGWYPIGRMTWQDSKPVEYEFAYVRGAKDAQRFAKSLVVPVPGFPDLAKTYRAYDVFPVFRSRAMNRGRPDLTEHLQNLGLNTQSAGVVEELAVSGGHSAKDRFETFPAIEPDCNGNFKARFIVHGFRNVDPQIVDKVTSLNPGDQLKLAIEFNNSFGADAVSVKTEGNRRLGWLPRYLTDVLRQSDAVNLADLDLHVVQVNHDAPPSHRLLVELSGQLPPGVDPLGQLEQYQPISKG